MRMGIPDIFDAGALDPEQTVFDPLELLADDIKPGLRQQVVNVGDTARKTVLTRQHAKRCLTLADGVDRRLERQAGQGGHARIGFAAGEVRIGAGQPLERNLPLHRTDASNARARSRSSAVSTPNGPCSMRTQAIRIPFSSARSCSSCSRRSSGLGGSET